MLVRDAYGRVDLPVDAHSLMRIALLKVAICAGLASNPPPAALRLIFCGRVLADEHTLSEALREVRPRRQLQPRAASTSRYCE